MNTNENNAQNNNSKTRHSKTGMAIGLTAGLVGGTVAGMVFGIPGLTNAADDGSTDAAAPAAIVQQVDPPADDLEAPTEPGAKLRELLQVLVDDGTITAAQADAVTDHLIENRPERGDRPGRRGPRGHGPFHGSSEAVLELLGIEAETLREELRAGSTLAEVAEANGVATQTLIDTLVDEAQARVDAAVDAGKVDAETAAERTADLEERITARVNGERPEGGPRGPGAPADGEN